MVDAHLQDLEPDRGRGNVIEEIVVVDHEVDRIVRDEGIVDDLEILANNSCKE